MLLTRPVNNFDMNLSIFLDLNFNVFDCSSFCFFFRMFGSYYFLMKGIITSILNKNRSNQQIVSVEKLI